MTFGLGGLVYHLPRSSGYMPYFKKIVALSIAVVMKSSSNVKNN